MSSVLGLMLIIIGLVVYFLPSIIGRDKKNATAIFVLNIFLGWTLVGWVVALTWALTKGDRNDPSKICPRCAEEIKKEAQVCRFCGYDFNPAPVAQGKVIPPRTSTTEVADLASRYGDLIKTKKL